MNLLLIDDHPLFGWGFVHALSHGRPDVHVRAVLTLDEGLEEASSWPELDAVLVDYRLGGDDGVEGLRRFGARHPSGASTIARMSERREFLIACAAGAALPAMAAPAAPRPDAAAQIRSLEAASARLGVCLLDTATGEVTGHRLDERFAMCSTFKLPLVAAVLREADRGRLDLAEVLPYSRGDLLPWAPVTGQHLDRGGLPIATLAQAAQEMSDGVAANLLVRRLGGPAAVTAKFREMGDTVSRLDRYEPDLGLVLSADIRDTTSPRAMAQLVRRITTGSLLQPASRQRLLRWMEDTQTGSRRLRAGIPADWRSGNKTGTGRAEGTTNKCNDVAITFPPRRSPIVVAAYFDSGEFTAQVEARHEAVLADVGRIAARWATR